MVNKWFIEKLPGVMVLISIGLLARGFSIVFSSVNHLIVAVVLGVAIANFSRVPTWAQPGINTYKLWLEAGIVIMGVRVSMEQLTDAGPWIVLLIVLVVSTTILLVEVLSRNAFGLSERLGSMIAAGMSICGVSAVVAVAGGIKARENQIAYAAASILLFDTITLLAFPVVGHFLSLPDKVFGIWAGLSMLSTGPVTAAGFAYSEVAGQWATITKLSRNTLIGIVVIIYSIFYSKYGEDTEENQVRFSTIWENFPKFVIGFLLFMLLASYGILSSSQILALENVYKWLFLVAFAGLGLDIKINELTTTGVRPVLLMLIVLLLSSVFSLLLLLSIF